jgi:hypothetical protein
MLYIITVCSPIPRFQGSKRQTPENQRMEKQQPEKKQPATPIQPHPISRASKIPRTSSAKSYKEKTNTKPEEKEE